MDSKHWDWGKGFCHKHPGNDLPCQVCIRTDDPDLERTPEEWEKLAASMLEHSNETIVIPAGDPFLSENPCKEVYERDREEWAERVKSVIEQRQDHLPESYQATGEYFDWKSVRPVGEPIKGSWPNVQNLPKADFRIGDSEHVKGIFVIESYDSGGGLIERIAGENAVSNKGFERMSNIDFSKLPMCYYPDVEAITRELIESREAAQNEMLGRLYSEQPLTLKNGDTLLVSYTVKEGDPNITMNTRPLPLAERLTLVAEQHRQRFVEAGIEDPDELLRLLGTEELIQPKIPGFELPTKLPRRVPVDMELIDTIIEAEGCSDELRAALMSQIAIYGAPTICGLLAQAGVDGDFIDSLTSNLQQ